MLMMIIRKKKYKNEFKQQQQNTIPNDLYLWCVRQVTSRDETSVRLLYCDFNLLPKFGCPIEWISPWTKVGFVSLVWEMDDRSGTRATAAGRKSRWSDQATRERTLWQYMTVTINSNLFCLSLSLWDIRVATSVRDVQYRVIGRNIRRLTPFGRHLLK